MSAKISNEIFYASVNTAAKDYLSKEFLENTAINIPTEKVKDAEIMKDVKEHTVKFDEIWTKFKQF